MERKKMVKSISPLAIVGSELEEKKQEEEEGNPRARALSLFHNKVARRRGK